MFDGGRRPHTVKINPYRRQSAIEMFVGTISTLINGSSEDFSDGLTSDFFKHHHDTFETLLNSSDILTAYHATSHRGGDWPRGFAFYFQLNLHSGVLNELNQFLGSIPYYPNTRPGQHVLAGEDYSVRYIHHIGAAPERFIIHVEELV